MAPVITGPGSLTAVMESTGVYGDTLRRTRMVFWLIPPDAQLGEPDHRCRRL
ncbi:MAG: hypothetical protein M3436_08330 [Pseudomonadota bacterium]|nr:hypothetical protein [Pseudomonadota bacterium]